MPVGTRVHYCHGRGGRGARTGIRGVRGLQAARRRDGCCCHASKAALSHSPSARQPSARTPRMKVSALRRGLEVAQLEVLCPTCEEREIGGLQPPAGEQALRRASSPPTEG